MCIVNHFILKPTSLCFVAVILLIFGQCINSFPSGMSATTVLATSAATPSDLTAQPSTGEADIVTSFATGTIPADDVTVNSTFSQSSRTENDTGSTGWTTSLSHLAINSTVSEQSRINSTDSTPDSATTSNRDVIAGDVTLSSRLTSVFILTQTTEDTATARNDTRNETEIAAGSSTDSKVAVCVGVSVGVIGGFVFIVIVVVVCRRRRCCCCCNSKASSLYDSVDVCSLQQNIYFSASELHSEPVRLSSDVILSTCRQAIEQLYTLKRLLDDYLDNGLYLEHSEEGTDSEPDEEQARKVRDVVEGVLACSYSLNCLTTVCLNASDYEYEELPPFPPRRIDVDGPSALSAECMLNCLLRLRGVMDRLVTTLTQRDIDEADVDRTPQERLVRLVGDVRALIDLIKENITNVDDADNQAVAKWLESNYSENIRPDVDVFNAELEAINPLFRTLADQLATVHSRLQTVELKGRWTRGTAAAGSDLGVLSTPVLGRSWKSTLLTAVSRTAVTVSELFTEGSEDIEAELETADVFHWHLTDGAEFKSLLDEQLKILNSAFDATKETIDTFFERLTASDDDTDRTVITAKCLRTLLDDTVHLSRILQPTLAPQSHAQVAAAIAMNTTRANNVIYGNGSSAAEQLAAAAASSSSDEYEDPATYRAIEPESGLSMSYSYFPGSVLHGYHYTLNPENESNIDPAEQLDAEDRASVISYTPSPLTAEPEVLYGIYDEEYFEISINRHDESLLETVLELYTQTPAETLRRQIKVTFIGEAGVDAGGLSREYFHIVFTSLLNGTIKNHRAFQGERKHLLPSVDHVLTDARVFWFIGVLVVQAAQRGCRGLSGLSDAIRRFLAAEAKMSCLAQGLDAASLDDISDLELKDVLQKVKDRVELSEDERSVLDQWLNEASFSFVFQPSTADDAIQRILCYYMFDKRMSQLQAIAEGMSAMNYRAGQYDIDVLFPLEIQLNANDFVCGLEFNYNDETTDTVTENYFVQFANELYSNTIDELSLEDLLQFIIGAPYFTSTAALTVHFLGRDESTLPRVHACSMEIHLPTVHETYDEFKQAMMTALLYGGGFGLA